jgi:hypothetical protein
MEAEKPNAEEQEALTLFAEYFWGGYLKWALGEGLLTADDDIAAEKAAFLAGFNQEDTDG